MMPCGETHGVLAISLPRVLALMDSELRNRMGKSAGRSEHIWKNAVFRPD